MTKSKGAMSFTKGPWSYDGHGINDTNGKRLWDGRAYEDREQKDIDASLIASALMLYEACKIALAESKRSDLHFKSVSPATVMLEKALASAEGRG